MANEKPESPVNFQTFFMVWARRQGWKVPPMHVRVAEFLDGPERLKVLLIFRGGAKSTICGIRNAFQYYLSRAWRIIVQSADDPTANKTSRDTKSVLRRHPLAAGILPPVATAVDRWSVAGNPDERNVSFTAAGIMSNITSSRADEFQFDDVEVPKNIKTAEARANLRARLDEPTHILVPGGMKTYVGTPHTHDSIYEEQIAAGAAVLRIPLFEHHTRYEDTAQRLRYACTHIPEDLSDFYVMVGIHRFARLLELGRDFKIEFDDTIVFDKPPGDVLDLCSGNAWPERFTRSEVLFRRRETRTLSAWDSQYQLKAKPVIESRLDPERLIAYDVEPVIAYANEGIRMMLGHVRIVSASAWWDVALGKILADASVFTISLSDERGRLYLHRMVGLLGDLEDSQCEEIRRLVIEFQLPNITIETNGPGGFVPAIARKKLAGTGCGVREYFEHVNKQTRILDAWEPPLSAQFLWAHTSVIEGPLWEQMRDFDPKAKKQADDYLDSGAGAITDLPVRIGKIIGRVKDVSPRESWRPPGNQITAPLDLSGD